MAGRTGAGRAEERALEGLLVACSPAAAARRRPAQTRSTSAPPKVETSRCRGYVSLRSANGPGRGDGER